MFYALVLDTCPDVRYRGLIVQYYKNDTKAIKSTLAHYEKHHYICRILKEHLEIIEPVVFQDIIDNNEKITNSIPSEQEKLRLTVERVSRYLDELHSDEDIGIYEKPLKHNYL